MNLYIVGNLEKRFEGILCLYQNDETDENIEYKLKGAIGHLKHLRKECVSSMSSNESELLIYCIDTMILILNDNKPRKAMDFADIARQITLVYQKKMFFHSLGLDIKNFRSKWGREYFPTYKRLYKQSVEKDPRFMTKAEKKDFIHKTKMFSFICFPVLILFMAIYYWVTSYMFPNSNEWPFVLGIFGCILVPCGFLNRFVDKQIAMSNKTANILLFVGLALLMLSWGLIYILT